MFWCIWPLIHVEFTTNCLKSSKCQVPTDFNLYSVDVCLPWNSPNPSLFDHFQIDQEFLGPVRFKSPLVFFAQSTIFHKFYILRKCIVSKCSLSTYFFFFCLLSPARILEDSALQKSTFLCWCRNNVRSKVETSVLNVRIFTIKQVHYDLKNTRFYKFISNVNWS